MGDSLEVLKHCMVIHHWAGPSVIAHLALDFTPDRAE